MSRKGYRDVIESNTTNWSKALKLTFFPFEVTAGILALVSLDFLNLGVPSPAPSLGELLAQGKNNLHALWILLPTFVTLSLAITLLTFIGEGIRNAFDPRKTL